MSQAFQEGLQDVIAGKTTICTVGKAGDDLAYRGYSIEDLCKHCQFEEVAYLLLYGKLPTRPEFQQFLSDLESVRGFSENTAHMLKQLPKHTHPMDVLRTGVSILGCEFPESSKKPMEMAHRLVANMSDIVLTWYLYHFPVQVAHKPKETSIAGRFLERLIGRPVISEDRKAMDCSLILYAEHGFNASTFACRVTTSTLSDMCSAVCSGIGTLKGPLHGGANEKAMEMLLPFRSVEDALAYVEKALANKTKIMGFGHRVYKVRDPRSDFMKHHSRRLAKNSREPVYYACSEAIEKVMWEKKKLFPNVDFFSATFYYYLGIPIPLYTPIFAISRISGWIAHCLEQRSDNRLIRPDAIYVGPEPQTFVPIEKRA